MRNFLLPGLLLGLCMQPMAAQTLTADAPAIDPAHLTVDAANQDPEGMAPYGAVWSPDGSMLTFMLYEGQDDMVAGKPGDIVAVDAATGKMHVLATRAQLDALKSAAIDEQDRDHRARYGMAAFKWADDSKHLLLDKGGLLWLYDIASGKGTLIVDTQAGSGDDPKFAPDAKSVSYIREHNLYVHPIGAAEAAGKRDHTEVALTATKGDTLLNGELDWVYLEELDARSNYFWSPDSKKIAYEQMDEAKVPQYPITDFLLTHPTVEEQRYPQPGDPNPGVRVGVVAATGGATKWVDVPLSEGNDYIPRFGWVNADTLWIEVLTRDQKHLNLYFADAQTGQTRLVHTDADPKYLEENYDITFLPDGRFLNTSWRDGHTQLYLYSFDAAHPMSGKAKLERQLTKGDYEVDKVVAPPVNGVVDRVFFTSTEGSPLDTNLWTMKLDGTGKQRLTEGKGAHNTMVGPDGRYFSDQHSTVETEPVAGVCAVGGGCETIWKAKPFSVPGAVTKLVVLRAADGKTTLYGKLTEPSGEQAAASVPLILNPYGGPLPIAGVTDSWSRSLFDDLLAQHGFAVLTLDNRGEGGRGRAFQQACYHDFGAVQFADQMAALDQMLKEHPEFDPKRVGWWGWSWGGTFTLYAMTHTDRLRAGVAVAPVTDFRNYDSIYTERYLGLPAENPGVYKAAAVVSSAANLKGHILIAQGTGDDNVHMSNTMQFIEPLIGAGVPYDLQLFPRLTHSLSGQDARDELFDRILEQFEKYLKPMPGK